MTQIIAAFISGFFLCLAISLVIHRRHKQVWQSEYRRLMGGVWGAYVRLVECRGVKGIKEECKIKFDGIISDMQKLHRGDK